MTDDLPSTADPKTVTLEAQGVSPDLLRTLFGVPDDEAPSQSEVAVSYSYADLIPARPVLREVPWWRPLERWAARKIYRAALEEWVANGSPKHYEVMKRVFIPRAQIVGAADSVKFKVLPARTEDWSDLGYWDGR